MLKFWRTGLPKHFHQNNTTNILSFSFSFFFLRHTPRDVICRVFYLAFSKSLYLCARMCMCVCRPTKRKASCLICMYACMYACMGCATSTRNASGYAVAWQSAYIEHFETLYERKYTYIHMYMCTHTHDMLHVSK